MAEKTGKDILRALKGYYDNAKGDKTLTQRIGGVLSGADSRREANTREDATRRLVEKITVLCQRYEKTPEELLDVLEKHLSHNEQKGQGNVRYNYEYERDIMWQERTTARNIEKEYDNLKKLFLDAGGVLYVVSILFSGFGEGIENGDASELKDILSTLKSKLYLLTEKKDGGYIVKNNAPEDFSRDGYDEYIGIAITDESDTKEYERALEIIKNKTVEMRQMAEEIQQERYFCMYKSVWESINCFLSDLIEWADSGAVDAELISRALESIKAELEKNGIRYVPFSQDAEEYFSHENDYSHGAFADSDNGNILLYGNINSELAG